MGTNRDLIIKETLRLVEDADFYDRMSRAVNPYGDGRAAARSVAAIAHMFGVGNRLSEFHAGGQP